MKSLVRLRVSGGAGQSSASRGLHTVLHTLFGLINTGLVPLKISELELEREASDNSKAQNATPRQIPCQRASRPHERPRGRHLAHEGRSKTGGDDVSAGGCPPASRRMKGRLNQRAAGFVQIAYSQKKKSRNHSDKWKNFSLLVFSGLGHLVIQASNVSKAILMFILSKP